MLYLNKFTHLYLWFSFELTRGKSKKHPIYISRKAYGEISKHENDNKRNPKFSFVKGSSILNDKDRFSGMSK